MTRLEELLNIIPETIEHPILRIEWVDNEIEAKWSVYNYPYILRIEKRDNKFAAFYVYTGFEGEIQKLPISDEEYQQYLDYGGVCKYTDRSKPTLEEALEDLLCWLKKDGHLNS